MQRKFFKTSRGCRLLVAMCGALLLHTAEAQSQGFLLHHDKDRPRAGERPHGPRHTTIEQRHDLRRERLDNWSDWEIVSPTSFRVLFVGGTSACYGYRAEVRETDQEIQVAVIEGLTPGKGRACTLVARYVALLLHTQAPIGNRKITHLQDVYLNDAPAGSELQVDRDDQPPAEGVQEEEEPYFEVPPALPLVDHGARKQP